jgi:MoxR-like ATPase
MPIKIVTPLARLGYDLAADLHERGFENVTVATSSTASYELAHGRCVSPSEVARLLDALRPLQPDAILVRDELDDDAVVLQLGDELPLSAWEVRLQTDSEPLRERCREMLERLTFRDLGHELGLQERNVLYYAGASVLARQIIRWQLRRVGLKVEEQRHESWEDDDDDLLLCLSDPALEAVSPLERFRVRVCADDPEVGRELTERLEAAGFQCLRPETIDASQALDMHVVIEPGPFSSTRASSELARMRVLVSGLLGEKGVDTDRYPLQLTQDVGGLDAVVRLPLSACLSGKKRPYDGPYPERFHLRIQTDAPEMVDGLRRALVAVGFREPEVEPCLSLLDSDFDPSRGMEKGFFLVWGAAGKQPEIARRLRDVVQAEMVSLGAAPSFSLGQAERFHADDQAVWIYFPTRGIADGTLLDKLCEPARFKVKVHVADPAEWQDVTQWLESSGYAAFEIITRPGGRPTLDYGAAPLRLVESLRDRVCALTGVTLTPRKCWNDFDEDVWIHLPATRPQKPADDDAGELLNLDAWLGPLPGERRPFIEPFADHVRIGAVTLPRRRPELDEPFVPDLASFGHFCLDERTGETLQHLAAGVSLREPCLLEGETSTSKTSSILYLAALLGQAVVRINLNGQTDTGELVGRYVPISDDDAFSAERSESGGWSLAVEDRSALRAPRAALAMWRWQDGLVVQAMKRGWWVLLDEVNLAEPQILERLNSVLEREPSLVLTEHDNSIIGPGGTPVHVDFRLFATMNPAEYAGRSVLSPAYRDRWRGYRFVARPGEPEYLAMLRFLVFGSQPEVHVLGQPYLAVAAREEPSYAALARWPFIGELLPALARFHTALERAAGSGSDEARIGARRKERYVFTRRGLLSVLEYLGSPLGGDGTRGVRAALLRYYLGRVSDREDQALVVQLLDAAGIGPNTWSIVA